ncbi:hypothetical protein PMZ80_001365 [Knufia obscura]|uniref:F-box domain-containing protein n=1 Tax=Knufia obscura TaxID=1635080 RepID=A0ABR0S2X0_9EURO|nr:hypothetical protein PMZ80_001365 [Knufia obscura]
MPALNDLSLEALARIVAHTPYHPQNHENISLVCRRWRAVMGLPWLPREIARHQYPSLYRLTLATVDDVDFSRQELLTIWRKDQSLQVWQNLLQRKTHLPSNSCMAATALAGHIADTRQKLIQSNSSLIPALQDWVGMLFLAKVVSKLPSEAVFLLRFLFDTTQYSIFGKFNNDFEGRIVARVRSTGMNGKATWCAFFNLVETTELLGMGIRLHACVTRTEIDSWFKITEAEIQRLCGVNFTIGKRTLGLGIPTGIRTPMSLRFAMHERLLNIVNEGSLLGNIQLEDLPMDERWSTILTVAYEQMRLINAAVRSKFSEEGFADSLVDRLDFQDIGKNVAAVGKELSDIDTDGISGIIREMYSEPA